MTVSELMTALEGHSDKPVVVSEIDSVSTFFLVESVTEEQGHPILMTRQLNKPSEFFLKLFNKFVDSQPNQHEATIGKSLDGKYQVSIDGKPLLQGFETEAEACSFLRGFILGRETGS